MVTPLQSGETAFILVQLALTVIGVAGMWKTFQKAGKPGWAAIIPIYNVYTVIKISDNPGWFLILLIVPIINIVIAGKISIDFAGKFGQGILFGLGLMMLTFFFYPLLGFGDYQYQAKSHGA